MKPLAIGQLARRAGITVEAVRFYERRGLLPKPGRTESGYRQYAEDALGRLRFIRRAKELGFTLAEVKRLLTLQTDPAATRADVRELTDKKVSQVGEQIRQLTAKRRALIRVRKLCQGDGPARDCPILQAIARTPGPSAND